MAVGNRNVVVVIEQVVNKKGNGGQEQDKFNGASSGRLLLFTCISGAISCDRPGQDSIYVILS